MACSHQQGSRNHHQIQDCARGGAQAAQSLGAGVERGEGFDVGGNHGVYVGQVSDGDGDGNHRADPLAPPS